MHPRLIAVLAVLCFAAGGGGCASNPSEYEEVLMPLQTGSTLQRRVMVKVDHKTKKKQDKKKRSSTPRKSETEPAETPPAEEENTSPPDRFR
jgi:hypothetical protein